jgi:hypothetical protein
VLDGLVRKRSRRDVPTGDEQVRPLVDDLLGHGTQSREVAVYLGDDGDPQVEPLPIRNTNASVDVT